MNNLIELDFNIAQWGKDRGITVNGKSAGQMCKLMEEVGELASGINKRKPEEIEDAIGDAFVVLSMIASIEGLTMGECVQKAWDEIKHRKGYLNASGVFVKEV